MRGIGGGRWRDWQPDGTRTELTEAAKLSSSRGPSQVRLEPVTSESDVGRALLMRVRGGGLVLYFRHADTGGEPCDRSFRVGDRAGQRNLSEAGRVQARRIGERLRDLGVPVALRTRPRRP